MSADFKPDLLPARERGLRSLQRIGWVILWLFSLGFAGAESQAVLKVPEFRHLAPLASVREAARAAGINLEGRAALADGGGVGFCWRSTARRGCRKSG